MVGLLGSVFTDSFVHYEMSFFSKSAVAILALGDHNFFRLHGFEISDDFLLHSFNRGQTLFFGVVVFVLENLGGKPSDRVVPSHFVFMIHKQ
jgi:hypothetical protein